jgi:outer membrane protein assembly factor BamA
MMPAIKTAFDSLAGRDSIYYQMQQVSKQALPVSDWNCGIVNEVSVKGNKKTSRRLILSTAGIIPGTAIKKKTIYNAISSLYATGLFKTVNIETDTGSSIRIVVEEQNHLRARLGLRFDEFHLGEGYIEPAYDNLFGSGISAMMHLQYGLKREKYAFILHGSQLFSSMLANNMAFRVYISRERIIKDSTYQVYDSSDTALIQFKRQYSELTLRKAGFLGTVGAQIGRFAMVDGGFRIERFTVTKSADGVFDENLAGFKNGLRYLMVRFLTDNLDRFPFPEKGQKHYIIIGGASDVIGGTESFLHLTGNFCWYYTLGRHTITPRIRVSWSNKSLPDVDKVYIGGAIPEEKHDDIAVYNLVPFTGLRPRTLSGDIMSQVHLEYRFNILKNLFLSGIIDWGNAWEHENFSFSTSTAQDFFKNAPAGAGLSLAYATPAGPIRLSWGRLIHGNVGNGDLIQNNDVENVLYFSAGYDF